MRADDENVSAACVLMAGELDSCDPPGDVVQWTCPSLGSGLGRLSMLSGRVEVMNDSGFHGAFFVLVESAMSGPGGAPPSHGGFAGRAG